MVSGFLAIKHGETKRGANLLDDENINARGLQTLVAAGAPPWQKCTLLHTLVSLILVARERAGEGKPVRVDELRESVRLSPRSHLLTND
jgi:hypothetical protein